MAAHSWHAVPVAFRSERAGRDEVTRFAERSCGDGLLGRRPSKDLMPILLACTRRLAKYRA
jgi:2,3-bisphosphoglycerate-independent phosphoglycerate mutase